MQRTVLGSRFGVSLGIAQVEVFSSAAAEAAVREAEQIARVAAGVSEPGTVSRPARLAELLAVSRMDRADVHAVLGDIAVAQARLHALQSAAVARLDELTPRQEHLPGGRAAEVPQERPDDWVADEVACVLQVAVGTASRLVEGHRALHDQFPAVWAALADGLVDVRRAQVLVDTLAHRKRSAGGGVDDEVVDRVAAQGIAWIRAGVGPTTLAHRLGAAVIAADPAEAERRAEHRQRRANVSTVAAGDGLAGLRADLLSAEDAAAMQARVDALASAWRRDGDRRPIGVLRVESLKQLLLRPWEALPAGVAGTAVQLTVRVDLSDLDEGADGAGAGSIGGTAVTPGAVTALLVRCEALRLTAPPGGDLWFEILDGTGRLQAIASPRDVALAAPRGHGLGPPPPVDRYVPSAAQVRFVRARDRHCRFPGCSRAAEYADLDHVVPYDHDDPASGGSTCVTNLVCLCRRHHRLKTHQPGWAFRMDPDGTLHVTLPTGVTRTSRPPSLAETDVLTAVLGPTPRRHRSPTVEQQAARRAAAAAHAETVAAIEAEVLAAAALAADPPPF